MGTDCISATATVGTLSINNCLDLGHDWLVGVVTEVHKVAAYADWSTAFALVSVPIKIAVELVH